MGTKVAYIMSRFPHLPETFILREMMEVERQGGQIMLYPLIVQNQTIVHPEALSWIPRANRFPWISREILVSNWKWLTSHPAQYTALVWRALWGNLPSPNFFLRSLAILPKSVYMAERMQAEGIKHIHAHYATHPAFAAWVIHSLTGIPYSITVHAHDIYVDRTMLGPKIRDASFVIAISEFNKQFLAKQLGQWTLDKTHVIHCGIQPEKYKQGEGKKSDRFEIVSIGSLQPYKGQRYLIEACASLRRQGLNFRCRIIGGGELLPDLNKLVSAHNLGDHVILTGPQTQDAVAKMLGEADCYVQPSIVTPSGKMEGIPVALMEAMACGLPVVATNISGIPELVRPNETGWLVPEKDPDKLAETIIEIATHPDEAHRRLQAGREFVHREFNIRKSNEDLLCLFTKSANAE